MPRTLETAEIIAVGSELLTPHRIDTNSLFLTERLNDLGIVVRAKTIVGDDASDLAIHLRAALQRADVVITTGGLGPTDDDRTRDVLATVMDVEMDEHPGILDGIRQRFQRRGLTMPAINRRQAMVPRGATPLDNTVGSAPGLMAEVHDRLVVLLPGPPREMQPMFEASVAAHLGSGAPGRRLVRRVLKITGRSESQVEELAYPIYSTFADGDIPVQTTILASPGQIELHLAAAGDDTVAVARRLDEAAAALAGHLGPIVFSTDGRTLEAVVGEALDARGWRIAVAESCTGGLVLGRLTEVPGSSRWVVGGVVAYDNAVKIRELNVPPEMLESFGAVSEPVARAMAEHVRERLGAHIGVGVTGIAGPGGGTPTKSVGTVVIAVARAGREALVTTHAFPGDREMVRRFSTAAALDLVRRSIAAD